MQDSRSAWFADVVEFMTASGLVRGIVRTRTRPQGVPLHELEVVVPHGTAAGSGDVFLEVALQARPPVVRSQAGVLRFLPGGKT